MCDNTVSDCFVRDSLYAGCRGIPLELVIQAPPAQLRRSSSRGQMVIREKLLEHSSGFLMTYANKTETESFTTLTVELCLLCYHIKSEHARVVWCDTSHSAMPKWFSDFTVSPS